MAGQTLATSTEDACRVKVAAALQSYDEVPADLREQVCEYLLTGRDASCLLQLAAAYQDPARKRFFRYRQGSSIRPVDRIERRKFQDLLQIQEAPAGYYQRLGEVASHVPEVIDSRPKIDSEGRVPDWFRDLIVLRCALTDNLHGFSYGGIDVTFVLQPMLKDLESTNEVASVISLVVGAADTPYGHLARHLQPAGDWFAIFAGQPEEFMAALRNASANSREETLAWLTSRKFDFHPVLTVIAELATSASKRVRPLAVNVLREYPQLAEPLLLKYLTEADAATRGLAAEALAAVLGPAAEPHLRTALSQEKTQRVVQTLETLVRNVATVNVAEFRTGELELPPIEMPTGELPLPETFVAQFREQLSASFDRLEEQYQKQLTLFTSPTKPSWMSKPKPPERTDAASVERALAFIAGTSQSKPPKSDWLTQAIYAIPDWSKWTDLTQLHLLHVVRFLKTFNLLHDRGDTLYFPRADWLESHRAAQAQPYGLREVDTAFATLPGVASGAVARSYLQLNNSWQTFLDWEPDAIWPAFAEHVNLFRDAILGITKERNDYWVGMRRRGAMRIAAMMPKLPREIENAMWSVALGEAKTDRAAARKALHAAENRLGRALEALADGRQGIRIAAAEMLTELGDKTTVDPLKKALKTEKQELVKGALLQAIELLGGDVDEFLGRRKQQLDAQKGLEKKRPKGMDWITLDNLPRVRWADDDKPVASEILQWWVVQSVQFKMPVCGAILRRSVAMCRSDDTAAFAKHLLSMWMAYDTKAPTREEALAEATKEAAKRWASFSWMHEYYKTEEKLRDELTQQLQNTFLQSAIDQKGMLAIVAAAGDAQCVKAIEKYIRKYHGHRLAQSKALLETLGWIEDASAVQLLLTLGNRFRTKAIRKRAAELVEELAQRQGWTMNQLADRTIPDAGFERETDAAGNPSGTRAELILDYGPRKFTVILGDDLAPVITRDDGKTVKTLPDAGKEDDPELAKAAKKEFSDAKKMVKEVIKSQAERLYEAACVQRSWPAAEWRRYLAEHPIAGALCRRVVWAAKENAEAAPLRLFRPLEDGTFTDVNDEEFTLVDTDVVLVAHSSLLDNATEQAWKQHLKDYEVPDLFPQFGRPAFRLAKAQENEKELLDYRGHMLTTFRLRSKANKLGWVRGDAEDGGSFSTYYKPFRSERIQAVIEFTGSYVPEQDIPAALRELYFIPVKPNDDSMSSWNPNKIRLGQVPPVLLSECFSDYGEIAAEGTGFDPEWEKKGLW